MTIISKDRSELSALVSSEEMLIDALESLVKHGLISSFEIIGDKVNIDCDYLHMEQAEYDNEFMVQSGKCQNNPKITDPLVRYWYDLLKSSGFVDIEERQSISRMMTVDDKQVEYYRKAGIFFNEFSWQCDRDKSVFENHCEGYSVRQIAKMVGIAPNTVQNIITRYRKVMV